MIKKNKIFDSFIFDGELELLEFRLTELSPFIDVFIIAELDSNKKNSVFIENKTRFNKWKKKIFHIFVTEESFLNKITAEFVNHSPDFDDVLLLSEINEIPNLNNKEELFKELKYGSIMLQHQNFVWNIDHIDNTFIDGSIVLSFSSILVDREIVKKTFDKKHNLKLGGVQRIKNGWRFSNFNTDDEFKRQIEDKLPPVEIDPLTTYMLVEHNGEIELPVNTKLLPYNRIGRNLIKKHLFLVESDEPESLEMLENQYNTVTIINFSNNLNEVIGEKVTDKTTNNVLYLPETLLYTDELYKFQSQYKINEVKRMFSTVFLQKQDTTTIIYNNSIII
jgi:hypothetical protein